MLSSPSPFDGAQDRLREGVSKQEERRYSG